VDLDRDEDAYLYKNFGENYFNQIDTDFEGRMNSGNVEIARGAFGFTVDTVDDSTGWGSNDIEVVLYKGSVFYIYLWVGSSYDYFSGASEDTTYYFTLQREADSDTVYLYIYSNEARGTLVDTLSMSGVGTNTKFRYFYAITSYNDSASNKEWDGYFQNIDLKLGPAPSVIGSTLGLFAPSIGLYDVRYKLRARQRDTALTTRVRNT
jgi:hypothetical protein